MEELFVESVARNGKWQIFYFEFSAEISLGNIKIDLRRGNTLI
jgi:hypothetical protein